jgi:hypothetical protein
VGPGPAVGAGEFVGKERIALCESTASGAGWAG